MRWAGYQRQGAGRAECAGFTSGSPQRKAGPLMWSRHKIEGARISRPLYTGGQQGAVICKGRHEDTRHHLQETPRVIVRK